MATYAELLQATENAALRNKVRVAVCIAAEKVRTASAPLPENQEKRRKWAAQALTNPDPMTDTMLRAIVVQNAAATSAQITGASDATVQLAVDNAIDLFADLLV